MSTTLSASPWQTRKGDPLEAQERTLLPMFWAGSAQPDRLMQPATLAPLLTAQARLKAPPCEKPPKTMRSGGIPFAASAAARPKTYSIDCCCWAPESGDAGTKNVPLGLALTLVVATLSGFAGVYFEKVLKGSRISVWVRNVHLAAISSVVAGAAVASRDRGALAACGFFGGYGPVAWGYVVVQAVGGLLIAAVVKVD